MSSTELVDIYRKLYSTDKEKIVNVETRTEDSVFITVDTGILMKYIFTYRSKTDYSISMA